MRIRITDMAADRSITLDLTNANHARTFDRLVLEINGGGMNAKSTANAMIDGAAARDGSLPFTRNGYRFERAE